MTMANSVKVKNERGYSVKLPFHFITIKYFVSTWFILAEWLQLSSERSRICCSCKLHVLSVGILTYTFIYSCCSNTYPKILLLEACISQIYVLCYVTDLGSCRLCLFHGKLYVNMCSNELPAGGVHAMNNVLTKWHIAISIDIGVLEKHWRMVRVLWPRQKVSTVPSDLCRFFAFESL